MKQPWVYMCSPSRSPLPPLSPPDPSRSSQCTRSPSLETDILICNGLKRIEFYFSYTKSDSVDLVAQKCQDPSSLQFSWPFSVVHWLIIMSKKAATALALIPIFRAGRGG